MAYEVIELDVSEGVATLRLNRPEALNALTMQSLVELRAALKQVIAASDVRCLVLTGAGRGFCTGVDLAAPRNGLDPGDRAEFLRDYFIPPYQLLAELAIPTIAAVNGPCAGAGASLALTCDIVVAAESAYFLQPFTNIGLVPDLGSTWLLPHLVGQARAAGLMLLGERLPARQAQDWGLIWKAVADTELRDTVTQMASRLAAGAPLGYALTKRLIREAFRNDLSAQMRHEAELQVIALQSEDHLEARSAFLEKRKPVFGRRPS